jgi:hypothetical protein
MLSILSIALYQLNALNLPNMYLIYIQKSIHPIAIHQFQCSPFAKYVPIHPTHSIHRPTALHQFNALHLPQDVAPYIQCTPFTISWNLVDFKKEREENVV